MSARTKAYDQWFLIKAGAIIGMVLMCMGACLTGMYM
jgi:hypothetical protein